MRIASLFAGALLFVGVGARPAAAQDGLLNFDEVRQLFTSKQPRAAANSLLLASIEFRKEMGRCHDATVGRRMLETEPKFNDFASRIGNGAIPAVGTLDSAFADLDLLLAQHHQLLALDGWAKPRFTTMQAIGRDLGLSANYLVRSHRWERKPLAADAAQVVSDALRAAKQLGDDPGHPEADTKAVIEALGRVVMSPTRIALAEGGAKP